MRRHLAAAAVIAAVLTACGSSSKPAAAPPTTPAAPPTTPAAPNRAALQAIGPAAANSFTVSLAKGSQGIFLIDTAGESLYVFAGDHGTTSGCTGGCAQVWSAYTVTGPVTTGPVIDAAEVSTADGQAPHQLTYYGHLLYLYSKDTAPGQTNGVGVPNWNLLGPFGNVMLPR